MPPFEPSPTDTHLAATEASRLMANVAYSGGDSPFAATPVSQVSDAARQGATASPVEGRRLQPVGPGRPAERVDLSADGRTRLSAYPVQAGKIQCPTVREEILPRPRLFDWLGAKIHHRIVLVIAKAGYGKTTLLADFSRRVRTRMLWYRLDEDDRSWVSFFNHLVAAGREHVPGFAPTTASLLSDMTLGGPTRETVTEAFLRDLSSLDPNGGVIVLDDYHLVGDAADIRAVMRQLIARAPERITFLITSRQPPALPLARARAQGEVAELSTSDLRFTATELEQLFSEAFHHPLEPDVLAELGRRTEGWVASLRLVQTAIRDRSAPEIRSFVQSLSGAEGNLHDYLAEEIVAELPDDLQEFLMRTALLETVTPELAAVAAGTTLSTARLQIQTCERLGFLSRGSRGDPSLRFHPLVRDFLRHRLLSDLPEDAVRQLHVAIASAATDWRVAAHHFAQAGETERLRRTLEDSAAFILATGAFSAAERVLPQYRPDWASPNIDILLSRIELRRGNRDLSVHLARGAVSGAPDSDLARANLMSICVFNGELREALALSEALSASLDSPIGTLARAMNQVIRVSEDAPIDDWIRDLHRLAEGQRAAGHSHYEGISLLNIATGYRSQANHEKALEASRRAVQLLASSSQGQETAFALLTQAWSLAHEGRLAAGRMVLQEAEQYLDPASRPEFLAEVADLETWYGSAGLAKSHLTFAEASRSVPRPHREVILAARTELALRTGQHELAVKLTESLEFDAPALACAHRTRQFALAARVAFATRDPSGQQRLRVASDHAHRQQAHFWVRYTQVLEAIYCSDNPNPDLRVLLRSAPAFASILAEVVLSRVGELEEDVLNLLGVEVQRRPERWLPCLRQLVDTGEAPMALRVGRLLEDIGEHADVARLRRLARRTRSREYTDLGRRLARRLAPIVLVEDLGRVSISVGARRLAGSEIRRKVLALLCYLVSRPGFAATRDAVVDALWPDLEPEAAANSLNQTVYFLRRVLDPNYSEDLSPSYLHHDSDLVWLDQELVQAISRNFSSMLKTLSPGSGPAEAKRACEIYGGKFALDFLYEDWAEGYRETLHAAYLNLVEAAVRVGMESGEYGVAIDLVQSALHVDPQADPLEASLLRLYRMTGAHAAAAEQYAHYASVLRDELGLDPPPLNAM